MSLRQLKVQEALEQLKNDEKLLPIKDPPLKSIKSVQFGVLSPEEIKGVAVCKITKSKITPPYAETVYDERMGPCDTKGICLACGENMRICPGHFGYIELATPVIHPQHNRLIVAILNCVCLNCSHLKLSADELKLELGKSYDTNGITKLKSVESYCASTPFCKNCEQPNATIIYYEGKICKVYTENKGKKRSVIPIDELMTSLKGISDSDLKIMGFGVNYRKILRHNLTPELIPSFRPEFLILTRLPVLPSISRPPNFEGGIKSDDDLTSSYTEIIKNNQKLIDTTDLKEKTRQDITAILEMYISSFIDNSHEQTKHTSGKPIKSIKERISSKHGHIRGKLMGKRVDVSARTVITADPTLRINEVGIPQEIAENLTFPEVVTALNYQKLIKLFDCNKINMIKRGDKVYMVTNKSQNKLQYGDSAYRHLQDGDSVVFNRQPTLHRGSMMAHVAKILPFKTFRLNLAVTTPYGADFDGKRRI